MKRKQVSKKFENKWILLDSHRRVIFSSNNPTEVVRKGRKYPFGKVSIEKKTEQGLCFF